MDSNFMNEGEIDAPVAQIIDQTTTPGYTYIDGSAVAGAVYGKEISGNFIDNLGTSAYNSFTPDVGVNQNSFMQTGSTTVTVF